MKEAMLKERTEWKRKRTSDNKIDEEYIRDIKIEAKKKDKKIKKKIYGGEYNGKLSRSQCMS